MKYLLLFLSFSAVAADNTIHIQQIGDNNIINVLQDGSGHATTINLGLISAVDNTSISIDQKDSGVKTASVEIKSGINNGINILQQGVGQHVANIHNLNGTANMINIDQNGSGNHNFSIINTNGTTNSGNTINGLQTGSGDKTFSLTLNGSTGATVGVQQTSQTPDAGAMTIQCALGTCGIYTYTRN